MPILFAPIHLHNHFFIVLWGWLSWKIAQCRFNLPLHYADSICTRNMLIWLVPAFCWFVFALELRPRNCFTHMWEHFRCLIICLVFTPEFELPRETENWDKTDLHLMSRGISLDQFQVSGINKLSVVVNTVTRTFVSQPPLRIPLD